jgi:TonB family protein
MTRRLTLLILAIISPFPRVASAELKEGSTETHGILGEVKAVAYFAPRPNYPLEAREKGITGHGVAILRVNTRTGIVTAARMEPSTGSQMLDEVALAAFRQWRFKPGAPPKVNVPIRFTLNGVPVKNPGGVQNAVYAARPLYPAEARSKRLTGAGIVFVDVDQKTGQVTSARMLQSTGYQILDEAALSAFRKWRFKPGTVEKVRIPISFTIRGVSY